MIVGKKIEIYGFHILRKFIESRHIYPCPLTNSNSPPSFYNHPPPDRKELLIPLRQRISENLFLPTTERGGENYDLFYQNSIRKYEDDLEH